MSASSLFYELQSKQYVYNIRNALFVTVLQFVYVKRLFAKLVSSDGRTEIVKKY